MVPPPALLLVTVFLAGLVSQVHATDEDDKTLSSSVIFASETLNQVMKGVFPTCPLERVSDFPSRDHFVSFLCEKAKTEDAEKIFSYLENAEGLLAKFSSNELGLDQFKAGLKFFLEHNNTVPKTFEERLTETWQIPTVPSTCQFSSQAQGNVEATFRNLTFVGVEHFYAVAPVQLKDAKQDLINRLDRLRPDALILEGMDYAHTLPCEQVLRSTLMSDVELQQEVPFLIKHAFLRKIALIPGDNTAVNNKDVDLFFGGDNSKAQDIKKGQQIEQVLYLYYQKLREGSPAPLNDALEIYNRRSGATETVTSTNFQATYKTLNQRALPTDFEEVYRDFTPTPYLTGGPRGTNELVYRTLLFRNQGLLRAIQISANRYQRPMVVFGSGHLSDLAPTLQKELGPIETKDGKISCK